MRSMNQEKISDREFSTISQLFYEGKWDKCEAEISELKEIYPGEVKLDFLESLIHFWTFYYCGKQPSVGKRFISMSEEIISASQSSIKEDSDDLLLIKSGLSGYQALTHVSLLSFKDALKSGQKAYKITQELERREIDDERASIGFGMFNYMLGSVPSNLKFVTKMMGLSGDKEHGIYHLKKAAESDLFIRFDGRMILAELFEQDDRYKDALKEVERNVEEAPENAVYLKKAADLCDKTGEADKRKDYLERILRIPDSHFGYQRKEARRILG